MVLMTSECVCVQLRGQRSQQFLYLLFIAGKTNVVGCDGVQEEPIEARQVPVHLKYTQTHTHTEYTPTTHLHLPCVRACVRVTMEKGWLLASSLMLVNGDSKMRASGGLPEQNIRTSHLMFDSHSNK